VDILNEQNFNGLQRGNGWVQGNIWRICPSKMTFPDPLGQAGSPDLCGMANYSSNEAQVRALISSWAQAVRDKDMNGIMARHTADILMFDVVMPFQAKGMEAYRKAWELFCRYSPGGEGSFELTELQVMVGDEAAFAHAVLKVFKENVRLTLGMRKVDGEWMIAHEHHSAPFEQPG